MWTRGLWDKLGKLGTGLLALSQTQAPVGQLSHASQGIQSPTITPSCCTHPPRAFGMAWALLPPWFEVQIDLGACSFPAL